MNNLNNSDKKSVNRILFITIIIFSLLIGIAYAFEDYISLFIVIFLSLILIFYVQNKFNIRNYLHSCKWL